MYIRLALNTNTFVPLPSLLGVKASTTIPSALFKLENTVLLYKFVLRMEGELNHVK